MHVLASADDGVVWGGGMGGLEPQCSQLGWQDSCMVTFKVSLLLVLIVLQFHHQVTAEPVWSLELGMCAQMEMSARAHVCLNTSVLYLNLARTC